MEVNMEEDVKRISEEKLDYYRNNIEHCPVDVLRMLYAELKRDFEYIDHEHDRLDKRNNELLEENNNLKYKYKKDGRVLFTPEAVAELHIPKALIKQRIKELKEMEEDYKKNYVGIRKDYHFDLGRVMGRRQSLEELLIM